MLDPYQLTLHTLTLRQLASAEQLSEITGQPQAEVEDAQLAHPAVVEAAVVGLPDAKWGERVTAAVVLRTPADPEQIRDFCARRLAGFKRPKSVEIWPDLPTSPVGKSLRREVRDRMLARKDS